MLLRACFFKCNTDKRITVYTGLIWLNCSRQDEGQMKVKSLTVNFYECWTTTRDLDNRDIFSYLLQTAILIEVPEYYDRGFYREYSVHGSIQSMCGPVPSGA